MSVPDGRIAAVTTTAAHQKRGFLLSLLTLLTLAGAILATPVDASASTRVAAETRVRANDHPTAALVAANTAGSPHGVGVASVWLRQLVSATGVATNSELHAFGNAGGPRPPRAGIDFEVGADGMVVPQSGPLPSGASTFAVPAQSGLAGVHHSIPAGTEMPPGFGVVADGAEVLPGSPHPPTHHTVYPTTPMTPEAFCEGFLCLPWTRAGRIK